MENFHTWCSEAAPPLGGFAPAGSLAPLAPERYALFPPSSPQQECASGAYTSALLSGALAYCSVKTTPQPPEHTDPPHCSPTRARGEGGGPRGRTFTRGTASPSALDRCLRHDPGIAAGRARAKKYVLYSLSPGGLPVSPIGIFLACISDDRGAADFLPPALGPAPAPIRKR